MKIYDDPSVELQRLNENQWFRANQKLLLGIANTKAGRDLLCIPQEYPRIVHIRKNCVHAILEDKGRELTVFADFRIGMKYANIIRYRWQAFNAMARYYVNADIFASPLTKYAMSVHADTLTAYPQPNIETTTVDGYTQYGTVGTGTNWTTSRNAAVAYSASDSSTTAGSYQGKWTYYDAYPWWDYVRGFYLFDTSSLTSAATISATTLDLYWQTVYAQIGGTNSKYTLCSAAPATNIAIITTDHNTLGTTHYSDDVQISGLTQNSYNTLTLNASGLAAVSKTGVTKLGMRTLWDIDLVDPSVPGGDQGDGGSVRMADYADTTSDPKLIVTYTVTSANSHLLLLGIG